MTTYFRLDTEFSLDEEDSTAEALRKFFGDREFTKKEAVDYIADLSEDREYAKWEFEQLVEAGYIKEV